MSKPSLWSFRSATSETSPGVGAGHSLNGGTAWRNPADPKHPDQPWIRQGSLIDTLGGSLGPHGGSLFPHGSLSGSGVRKPNAWQDHVKQFRAVNPSLSFKQALVQAGATYKK